MDTLLPNLSRLRIGTRGELSEDEVLKLLMESSDDEDAAPVAKRPKALPLLKLKGVPVNLVSSTPTLISNDPTTWTAFSRHELLLLFAISSLNTSQPRPLVSDAKRARNIAFTASSFRGGGGNFLVLGMYDLCKADGDAERGGGGLVVLGPSNQQFANENETIKIKTINEKTVEISTNPYRPTFLKEKTFLRMDITEISGTRSVRSNEFEMFKGRPKHAPPMLKSLSIMQAKFCRDDGIETFQFVSAQLNDPFYDDSSLQRKQEAGAKWKARVMTKRTRS